MRKRDEKDIINSLQQCLKKVENPEVVKSILSKINENPNQDMTLENFCRCIMDIVLEEEKNKKSK